MQHSLLKRTGDFLSQFDVLLREALTSEKIRLSKAQVKRANRAIIRDAATEFDLQYIQEVQQLETYHVIVLL
jgi:hypothetical protein